MVDLITWNSLTEEDRREFDALRIQFVKAVIGSSARDGVEFAEMYRVEGKDENYYITDGETVLGGIQRGSRALIEALFNDAAMNYGR
jgi:hypothetical protein